MKKGDKFYEIVKPVDPITLSGDVEEGNVEYILVDGKRRKIGEWFAEEHLVEEVLEDENIVMDEECCEFEIDRVIWDYAEAEAYASKLNAEEARDERNNKAVKGIV